MICKVCGSEVADGSAFCPNCGSELVAEEPFAPAEAVDNNDPEVNVNDTVSSSAEPEEQFDPEGGTTVLSDEFLEAAEATPAPTPTPTPAPAEEPKPQKVVTPAPVTGSRILSNDSNNFQGNGFQGNQFQGNAYQGGAAPQNNFNNMSQNGGGYQAPPVQNAPVLNMNVPSEYNPISAWGYIGYSLLYSIPIVGLIMLFVNGFGSNNINVRNYARSYLIMMLISIILYVIVIVIMLALGFSVADAFGQ